MSLDEASTPPTAAPTPATTAGERLRAVGGSGSRDSTTNRSDDGALHVLVGCSGSVASIKIPLLVQSLLDKRCFSRAASSTAAHRKVKVRVVATGNSLHFFDKAQLEKDTAIPVIVDSDEWVAWEKIGDPVVHIELRKWAHMLVVAPLDANTLAKVANGQCDNLLTCIIRAWDPVEKPLVLCPAMNTLMWSHPVTSAQVAKVTGWGCHVIPPVAKKLACGDVGVGALAAVSDIVAYLVALDGDSNMHARYIAAQKETRKKKQAAGEKQTHVTSPSANALYWLRLSLGLYMLYRVGKNKVVSMFSMESLVS